MNYFAFTIKYVTKEMYQATEEQLREVLTLWRHKDERIEYCDVTCELDSHGHKHLHGILKLPKKFYRKNLAVKGLHYYLKPLKCADDWIEYCNKDQPNVIAGDIDDPREPSNNIVIKKNLFSQPKLANECSESSI